MKSKIKKEIPIKDAINLAVQTYIKNGKYHRENQYEYVETDDGPTDLITVKGNKHLMREMFSEDQVYIDPKCDDMVQDIYTHYQGLIFKIMANNVTDFSNNVYNVISKETVGYKDLGYLAPLPSLYEAELQRIQFVEGIANSQWVGTIGAKQTVRATLHEARYIRTREFHVYTFISDGNLITHFSSKHPTDWKVDKLVEGNEYNISFKVKRQGNSSFYDCKDTVVNYLKISD